MDIPSMRFLFRECITTDPRTSGWILYISDLPERMLVLVGTEIISGDSASFARRAVGI
jgi:hypothetical protein